MPVTRIKNNQITDATINAASKLADTSITAGKLENNLTYGSNLTVTGNLTVNGATTTVSTTNTTVEDAIMVLNSDATGAFANDVGLYMERGDNTSVFMGYDGSATQFAMVETSSAGSDTAMTVTDYADLRLGGLTADDAITATGNIDGGNIISQADVTTVTVNASSTIDATGNITGGNLITSAAVESATVDATGNITGGNLITSAAVEAATVDTTGEATLASATVSDLTSGRVVLAGTSGAIEDSNNLTFDGSTLGVTGAITASTTVTATGNVIGGNLITSAAVESATVTATGNVQGGNLVSDADVTTVSVTASGTVDATGNITGGNLITSAAVEAATVDTTGEATLASATISDLTSGRVVLAGTSGALEDSTNLTFNGSTLAVTGAVTASTTVTATGNVIGGNLITAAAMESATATVTGNITGGNLLTSGLTQTGDLTVLASGTIEMNENVIGNVADPVALQDAATKNYVDSQVSAGFDITDGTTTQNVTSGDTLTFSGTTDEVEVTVSATDTVTIGLPDDVVIGNDLTVTGDLTVNGTTTTVNSTTSTLQDPIFQLGRGADNAALTSDDAKDRGISMYYYEGSEKVSFMGFETTDNKFVFIPDATISGEVVSGAAGAAEFGALDVTTIDTTGEATLASATVSDLTSGRVVLAGTSGALEDSTNLTFNGSTLAVTGAITGSTTAVITGNITGGNLITSAAVEAATVDTTGEATLASATVSDLTSGRVVLAGTSGALEDSTNLTFNGSTLGVTGAITASTTVTATGNVTGGNLITSAAVESATVTATGNVQGGNIVSDADVTTVTVNASSTIDATGNITGGNLITSAAVEAATVDTTGEATLASATVSDLTSGRVVLAGTSGALEDSNNLTFDGSTLAVTGAATVSTTLGVTGNVTGGNLITGGLVDATGSITAGTTIDATGNITGGNLITSGTITDGTATISGGDIAGATSIAVDNLSLDGNDITATSGGEVTINEAGADVNFRVESDNNANMIFVDAGTDSVNIGTGTPTTDVSFKVGTTDSIMIATGNTAQRPASPVVGMLRFSTTNDSLEQYSSVDGWEVVGAPSFTVIASETFDGDNSTVAFTLSESQTTASCIVSINGVVQLPTTAYGVSGTTLTFTEAPLSGDKIEVRKITTTTTLTNLTSTSGGAVVSTPNEEEVDIKGNLMPAADSTYSIGNATTRWTDIYVDAGTIHLGAIQLKESSGELAIFASDGTTPADITAGSLGAVSADAITSGTSNVKVATNSSVTVTVAGSTAATFAAGGLTIAGDLTVSGTTTTVNSTTLDVADKNITVASGAADSSAADGAGLTVDGADATFTYTHSGTKWNMNKDLDLGSNNFITSGEFQGTATSAQYADLAEKYEADADYEPGTVVHFGGEKEVSQCDMDHCTKVAGVVSTSPAYRMNDGLEAEHVAMVALTGRVPCKVQGPVAKGDMMVSAGNGKARAEADPKVGAVIGKALEDFNGEEGVIEVVVGKH